jgi:uncharacterized protein YndB with AHSA1/START domain
VAVRASREIVIDSPPEAVMDALADVESLPSYSAAHERAEVVTDTPTASRIMSG